MKRPLPSLRELEDAYREAAAAHERHLKAHGVNLPDKASYKWIWLAMLCHYKGDNVHKDEISRAVQRTFPNAGQDQQVRHLKRDGWDIAGSGGFHALKYPPHRPSPEFENDQRRRSGEMSAKNFEDIKKVFNYCCATCGAKEGESSPRYGDDIVRLQKGHKDPDEPAAVGNIIPQCQFCNRAYRRDFVFDDKGRVRAVADVRPVKLAAEKVKRKIWEYLRGMFD